MFEPSDELLATLGEAQALGAIGPAPLRDHVAHAASFAEAWRAIAPPPRRALDLGSGGGLPGLVLAERCPDLALALLDGRRERARLLEAMVARLGIESRVEVFEGRAEELAHRPEQRSSFDLVVARGFAPPPVTAECAAGFLVVGGLLVVSEPPTAEGAADRWPTAGCDLLGLELERVVSTPFALVVLRQRRPCPERFPRRVGVPAKRPLF